MPHFDTVDVAVLQAPLEGLRQLDKPGEAVSFCLLVENLSVSVTVDCVFIGSHYAIELL